MTESAPTIKCICCEGEGYHDEDEDFDCGGTWDEGDNVYECGVCDGAGTVAA